jgi:hypothetical protein
MDYNKLDVWPKDWVTYYIETAVIILMTIFSMSLQYGRFDSTILLSTQLGIRIFGTLLIWFANKFTLEYILQSKIDSNKVTQFLPFELTVASVAITSIIYLIFYPILVYLNDWSFVLVNFFRGLFATCGFSLLIVIFYAGIHIWRSWWSDGKFLFQVKNKEQSENNSQDFITIKNSRGSVNYDLKKVLYFISEFKIVFLVDTSGKKCMTQYSLSELENILDSRYFRLNRRILVSHQVISRIKKLPNHRLLVTIGQSNESHYETISRYKSTRFKQWFDSGPEKK